jgi:uncharacterized protein YaaN involved in tellurite resistance
MGTAVQEFKTNAYVIEPSPQVERRAVAIRQGIDIRNTVACMDFGQSAVSRTAEFSDQILEQVKTQDAGAVGEKVTAIILAAKGLDPKSLEKKGFLARLFGKGEQAVEEFKSKFNTLKDQIDHISTELTTTRGSLIARVKQLDELYAINLDQFYDLAAHIEAGEQELAEAKAGLPALLAAAEGDDQKSQELADLQAAISRFEKRVYDLQLIRTNTVQTAYQIRMIQSNSVTLADKIQSTISVTVPLWKKQFVMAVALNEQAEAVKLEEMVNDANNQMLRQNAELMKMNSINIARANERAVLDVAALEDVNTKLIETLSEVAKIRQEGEAARVEGVKRLTALEGSIRATLGGKQEVKQIANG